MTVSRDENTDFPAILAIDTSTEACSAALACEGDVLVRYEVAPRRHAALVLSMVESILAEAGIPVQRLDALAFCRGPGSFTGVRIGAGVVQGLALATDLPVVPVSSLQALAQRAHREAGVNRVLSAIDARMREIYWAVFGVDGAGVMVDETQESVSAPGAVTVPASARRCWGAGTGWSAHPRVLRDRCEPGATGSLVGLLPDARDALPMAGRVLDTGGGLPPEGALPVYLRDRVTD